MVIKAFLAQLFQTPSKQKLLKTCYSNLQVAKEYIIFVHFRAFPLKGSFSSEEAFLPIKNIPHNCWILISCLSITIWIVGSKEVDLIICPFLH